MDFLITLVDRIHSSPRALHEATGLAVSSDRAAWISYWRNAGFLSGQTQISDVVYSQIRTSTICTQHFSQTFESVLSLRTSTVADLVSTQLLTEFFAPAVLSCANAFLCSGCKVKQPSTQSAELWLAGDVLFYQLKVLKSRLTYPSH